MKYKMNDIVIMKKDHPCKLSNKWQIIRMGADIRIKCLGCGHSVMMPRQEFERKLKSVEVGAESSDNGNVHSYDNLKINDTVSLKHIHSCESKKWGFYNDSDREYLYTVIEKRPQILVKCNDCNKVYGISVGEYSKSIVSNKTAKTRYKAKKNAELSSEKTVALINKDKELQKTKLGVILKPEDIVILPSEYECNECGETEYRIISIPRHPELPITIKCNYCEEKSFEIDRSKLYENIVEINPKDLLSRHNPSFISLEEEEGRLQFTDVYRSNLASVIAGYKLLLKLQLIDSNNNHVTVGHQIENRVVNIAYSYGGSIRMFKYKCHYCKTCDAYFDFYNSFINQIENAGIERSDLKLRLTRSSSYGNYYDFEYIDYDFFNSESFLHSLGYKVGEYGLLKSERHALLKSVIEDGLITISEVKSTINSNIKQFKYRDSFGWAVSDWEEDLQFVNSLIEEKN